SLFWQSRLRLWRRHRAWPFLWDPRENWAGHCPSPKAIHFLIPAPAPPLPRRSAAGTPAISRSSRIPTFHRALRLGGSALVPRPERRTQAAKANLAFLLSFLRSPDPELHRGLSRYPALGCRSRCGCEPKSATDAASAIWPI